MINLNEFPAAAKFNMDLSPGSMIPINDLQIKTILIYENGKVLQMNELCRKFLNKNFGGDFDRKKFFSVNNRSEYVSILCAARRDGQLVNHQIVLHDTDGSSTLLTYYISYAVERDYFVLQFYETSAWQNLYSVSIHNAARNELQKLNPYLNKYGKELLADILQKVNPENILHLKQYQSYFQNEVLLRISSRYPVLSQTEVSLCGFYALQMSITDMSMLLNRSNNSIYVNTHRILRKLGMKSREELITTMCELTKGGKEINN
ncbi:MAG: hypothetical protein H6Q19_350 [Bacteroidetes bacterium]|nr:hypothetical protein [Bacteroidota bacterium]